MTPVSSAYEKDHQSLDQLGTTPTSSPSLLVAGRSVSAAEHRAIVAEIQSKIVTDKNDIDVLQNEQQGLQEILAVVCMVLALPDDIAARIFVQCLPSESRVHPSPHTAPLLLAQICRQWRVIALATCELWSSVFLDFPERTLGSKATKVLRAGPRRLLAKWVSRAKGHPLSFGLNANYTSDKLPSTLLAIISPLSAQIKRLELHLTTPQFRELRPLNASFPLLREFATSPSLEVNLPALLKSAPALRDIRLIGRQRHHSQVPASGILELLQSISSASGKRELHFLDTKSLTDRSLLPPLESIQIDDEISIPTFLAILQNFPRLTSFTCHISWFSLEEGMRQAQKIVYAYPNLRSLNLTRYRSILPYYCGRILTYACVYAVISAEADWCLYDVRLPNQ
ncbi:hypothetical protein C8R44DRAFT_892491 [Mycena epipterygia]|nr:hypothetical protein C8R44DRAFT_892491 [Mycena epipterygia]